jgi:hypothetical protein
VTGGELWESLLEGGVRRVISAEIALVQQTDGQFEITFLDLATFGGCVNRVADP